MKLKYILFLVLLAVLVTFTILKPKITKKSNFPTPSPTSTPIFKLQKGIIFHGDRNKKLLALTFDADMTPKMKKDLLEGKVKTWYNQAVVDVLTKTQTPATFFLTGMWIELYSDQTRELSQNPLFELANHSYSHPAFAQPCFSLGLIPDTKDEEEISKTQKLLKDIAKVDNHLFRFPGGCYSPDDIKIINNLGLEVIQWDLASRDAFSENTEAIVKNVLKKAQNGSIIVFHLNGNRNAPKTAEALPEIISTLKKEGYSFVKVSEMLAP